MNTVDILRELGRRRSLLCALLLVSIAAGVLVTNRVSLSPPGLESRQYGVGIATVRALVDTPGSQVVKVNPRGSETLGARASLLASLMVEGKIKAAIAHRVGVPPARLLAASESTAEEAAGSKVSAAHGPGAGPALTTRVLINPGGEQLPILEVEAEAADAEAASRLADAAMSGLLDYLGRKALEENVSEGDRLQVSPLGVPQIQEVTRGPGRALSLAAALMVFIGGCGAIVVVARLRRDWYRSGADHDEPGQRHDDDSFNVLVADLLSEKSTPASGEVVS